MRRWRGRKDRRRIATSPSVIPLSPEGVVGVVICSGGRYEISTGQLASGLASQIQAM